MIFRQSSGNGTAISFFRLALRKLCLKIKIPAISTTGATISAAVYTVMFSFLQFSPAELAVLGVGVVPFFAAVGTYSADALGLICL